MYRLYPIWFTAVSQEPDRVTDSMTGRYTDGPRGRWAAVTDIHPALCEPHATVIPSQPGRKAPLLSLQAVSCQTLQCSSSWAQLWTQTLQPSAREELELTSKQLTATQWALKGPGLFMESFKVTAPWASLSLTTLCSGVRRAGAWLMLGNMV